MRHIQIPIKVFILTKVCIKHTFRTHSCLLSPKRNTMSHFIYCEIPWKCCEE